MMASKSVRVMNHMMRLMASRTRVPVVTLSRAFHNLPDNSSLTPGNVAGHHANKTLYTAHDLDSQLNEVKVFQDEQIIQLAFKSGQAVNYTMVWLRNLCSCPECFGNKFRAAPTEDNQPKADGKLSVVRVKCEAEDELQIEWLDSSYKSHTSRYNLKYLSLHTSHMQ